MVIVAFPPGEKYAVNYTTLDQYDYGQILRIQGLKLPKTVEVHFSTQETGGTSITRVGVTKDGVTDVLIPDSVLENGDTTQNYSIFAFVYVTDATSGKTEYRAKLEVKARPKPEVPGGGDNPDIFHEAVLEVRKSAEKAEEAQKQAEGWAHGREDLPERAEDNAMYYAGKASEDAKKTAQDRTEVERLVESVSGIDEQVAKVEKLSKDAQEAATQAEIHRQAAETAKESVENLSAQVQKNKESVDKTVQDFNLTAQQALADVNNAGQTQTERVQSAGTTAVENIENAQNTATQAVETAKNEAIKAVQTEGTTQTGNVTAEGERQVQAVQTAAQEIVADREQIQKNKTDIAELRQKKADAIVNTVSGTLLNIRDSAERKNKGFGMSGKMEQVQTTGAQLFEASQYEGVTKNGVTVTVKDGVITATGTPNINTWIQVFVSRENYQKLFRPGNKIYLKTNKSKDCNYDFGIYGAFGLPIIGTIREGNSGAVLPAELPRNDTDFCFFIDTKIGTELKGSIKPIVYHNGDGTWEPYTGGKPSPSPEYPQEIKNSGKWNEEKQKYEVDVKISNKNLFDLKRIKNGFVKSTGNGFDIVEDNMYPKSIYLDIIIPLKAGQTLNISGVEQDACRIRVKHDTGNYYLKYTANKDAEIIICFYSGLTDENKKTILIEISDTPTNYEPYKEQTLTLTSDRPLTKWDRLVEQGGEIGWLYATKYIEDLAEIIRDNTPIYGTEQKYFNVLFENEKFNYSMEKVVSETGSYKVNKELYTIDVKENTFLIKINANDTIQTAKEHLHYSVMYNTTQTEFVPLPQLEQDAIRALATYYPTTVVSNSEDMEMELTYVADTKNYTDRKIEEAVSAQVQNLANLLSLMPLSTQAAMIENDTNNILNMEVQK